MASKDQFNSQQITTLAQPLIWFASGVGFAVGSSCFSYVANFAIAATWQRRDVTLEYPYFKAGKGITRASLTGLLFRVLTVCAAVVALCCFGQGVWNAKKAFEQISVQAAAQR